MAFQPRDWSVIAYANGFTLWHYKTKDYLKDIQDGYFPKNALDLMNVDDIMIINAGDTTGIRVVKSLAPFVLKELD